MNKRRVVLLVIIFAIAALVGSQRKLAQDMPRATPESSPLTRSEFAQAEIQTELKSEETVINPEQQLSLSIQRLAKSMPSKKQIRALGEQAIHHLPLSIAELSEELGSIKQLIHDNPNDGQIIGKAIAFYRTCSAQAEWPSSVRALCLANLHEVAGESFDSAPVELYRLAKLAVELPET